MYFHELKDVTAIICMDTLKVVYKSMKRKYKEYRQAKLDKLIKKLEEPMTPLDWVPLRVKFSLTHYREPCILKITRTTYHVFPHFLPLQPPLAGAGNVAPGPAGAFVTPKLPLGAGG